MKRDPIINAEAGSKQSARNDSAGRIKSISGGSPNFSGGNATTNRSPSPNNPYKGR